MKHSEFEAIFKELSAEVALDKDRLDEQLADHGELVRQVGDLLAIKSAERDEAKRVLGEIEATADKDIREDADREREKVSETEVKQRVMLDDRVIEAKAELGHLNLIVARLGKLEQAYLERRRGFERLVELYTGQYWNTRDIRPRIAANGHNGRRERVR